jgi:hypothetical protein
MRKINIKAVKDGMILAEPLKSDRGNILLEKGTALTETFSIRLAQRGIDTVCVEGEPESEEEMALPKAQVVEIQKIPLEKLFDNKIVNNSMQIIYEGLKKLENSNA